MLVEVDQSELCELGRLGFVGSGSMSPFVDMKRTGWGHCSVRFFDLGFVITNKGAGDKEETGKSNDSDQPHRREKNPRVQRSLPLLFDIQGIQ